MMTQSVTIDLPDYVYTYLRQYAKATGQPIELLILQCVIGNLPPSVDSKTEKMRSELLALQGLSVDKPV